MLQAAVSDLLSRLTQVLKYHFHLIAGVEKSMQRLCQELTILKGLIVDFAGYDLDSKAIKELVNEIREVINEAEDAVDTYLVQAAVPRSRNWIEKRVPKNQVEKEIEIVSAKIKTMNRGKVRNGLEVLQNQAIASLDRPALPKSAPITEEENIVGFDDAAEAVIKFLTQGPEQFATVSIIGMLGLGKTTLAKMVFKDPIVDYEYMIRAFVYVSQEYNIREVFLNILSSFTHVSDEVLNMKYEEELGLYVRHQLEGKQYLIVLDDLWETDVWERLKHAFPTNNKRCRVLITTRYWSVAPSAEFNMHFQLNFLSDEKSRELLRWRVFQQNRCPPELQEYEVQILEKCKGLPLAIVVMAGIICNNKYEVAWWNNVASGVKDYMTDTVYEQITSMMELMYRHLPEYLKPCYLYLGVFKEDAKIPVWKLMRLWMAEGLIQEEGDVNLEDIAEQYLEELVQRNLLIVVDKRSNGKIKICRMHDTLREFCKSEGFRQNMFREIRNDDLDIFWSKTPGLDEYRRLCINNVNINTYLSGKISGKLVRSFLAFTKEDTTVQPTHVSSIPKAFKLLRVLEIQALNFTRFPSDLCNLVLLKYVAISITFAALPQAMSSLWNMQTLIVNTTSHYLEIKADIWNLLNLRHLHTNASTTLCSSDPTKIQNNRNTVAGKNLQTLSTISPESCRKEFFEQSPNIKKLGISGPLATLFKVSGDYSSFESICKLQFLENLKLLNNVKSPLDSLPSAEHFPAKLTKLTLSGTLLDWNEMSTLGKLEKLEVLKVKDNAFQGRLWQTEKGGFLQLKHLYIGCSGLASWEASVEHFPILRSLELNNCYDLEAFPHGLADIPSLQMVVLHCTNRVVASMVRQLQKMKEAQAENDSNSSCFKLSIYPPDH